MDDRAAAQPHVAEARYEALTHGPRGRRNYYNIRLRIGFSAAEWDSMGWHHQRMYVEEMADADYRAEYREENGVDPPDDFSEPELTDRDEQLYALADLGVTVNRH